MLAVVDATTGVIVVGVLALGGPLLTYLGLRRKSSGRIGATEAETLWAEAERMRAIYREEVTTLRVEALALREEVSGLRREVVTLREDAAKWRTEALNLMTERDKHS